MHREELSARTNVTVSKMSYTSGSRGAGAVMRSKRLRMRSTESRSGCRFNIAFPMGVAIRACQLMGYSLLPLHWHDYLSLVRRLVAGASHRATYTGCIVSCT